MLLTIAFCSILTVGYMLLMYAYHKGWRRQKDFLLPALYEPKTNISIVIPARNESKNIGACIDAILAQKYPIDLFEIIVVDDHSEDNTAAIVAEYADKNVRCINLANSLSEGPINSYKKAALAVGIAQSNNTLIVTTDADCTAPNVWLMHIAAIYEQENPAMIVAPVIYTCDHNFIQLFQLIDFMSMQGITAAAHNMQMGNMSNGANLAFSKVAYEHVNGYNGIQHMASGDDYLLMMKIKKASPGGIAYLKSANAIVSTAPQPSWGSFLQQRIRWASKSGKYNDARLTAILILVYLFNLALFTLAIAGFFNATYWTIAAAMFVLKVIAEYLYLRPVARFFRKEWVLKYFPFLQPIHIVYIVIAGFLGFTGGYTWKGRKVK